MATNEPRGPVDALGQSLMRLRTFVAAIVLRRRASVRTDQLRRASRSASPGRPHHERGERRRFLRSRQPRRQRAHAALQRAGCDLERDPVRRHAAARLESAPVDGRQRRLAGSINRAIAAEANNGYVTVSTNTGHTADSGTRASWALNQPERQINYAQQPDEES